MGSLYAKDVINVAKRYEGYHEGASNWNIFAQRLDACGYFSPQTKQNIQWCGIFVDACMLEAAIPEDRDDESKKYDAQYFQYQPSYWNLSAGVKENSDYYKAVGEFYEDSPEVGDVIYFNSIDSNGNIIATFQHMGLIIGLSDEYIVTIEGNAGDMVQVKYYEYSLIGSKIAGFGRPRYDGFENPADIDHKPEPDNPDKDDDDTDSGKVNIELDVLERYSTGEQVTTLKALLRAFGYGGDELELDGDFDWATEQAVLKFQRMHDIEETGIVDEAFWNLLLK